MPAREFGEQLFNDPAFAGSQFNTWSCATCHAVNSADQRVLSGHPLQGVTARGAWWGGQEHRLIDAASFCYVAFMRGAKALQPDEPRSRALYEYLASLSGEPAERAAQPLTLVANIVEVPRGEPAAGSALYARACFSCHGAVGTGAGRNTERGSILPDVAREYGELFAGTAPSLVFIEKVRHGQFFGVGGNMPPFAREMLSDEQLGAVLSYLGL